MISLDLGFCARCRRLPEHWSSRGRPSSPWHIVGNSRFLRAFVGDGRCLSQQYPLLAALVGNGLCIDASRSFEERDRG